MPIKGSSPIYSQNSSKTSYLESFAALLKEYSAAKALSDGQFLHSRIFCHGYEQNTLLGNYLINLYGSCGHIFDAVVVSKCILEPNIHTWNILIKAFGQNGNVKDAKEVFDSISNPDIISWNTMIAAFAQNSQPNEALDLFHQMTNTKTIRPNDITLVCALDACSSLCALEEGQLIQATIIACGYEDDVILSTATMNMYKKCDCFDEVRNIFLNMPQKNVVSWNTMISAFVQKGCHQDALALIDRMQVEGVNPTSITYISVLDACPDIETGYKIHAMVVSHGFDKTVSLETAIVNLYGKCGALLEAKSVFCQMKGKTVVAWNTMISIFSQNGLCHDALTYFQQLCAEGIKPNDISFLCSINTCADLGALVDGHTIHSILICSDRQQEVMMNTSLINMYGKCGSLHDAMKIFNNLCNMNSICWTAMIGSYVQNGQHNEALYLFHRMYLCAESPDNITLGFIVGVCANLCRPALGKQATVISLCSNYVHDTVVCNEMIKMYGKCGNAKDAQAFFDRMQHRSSISWTTIMGALINNDKNKEALQLFHQMHCEGVIPDRVAFVSVLDACTNHTLLRQGKQIEICMVKNIDDTSGSALINMYGKCGSISDVKRVFDSMKCRDVVTWTSIIMSCSQNGQIEQVIDLFNRMQADGIKPNDITFLCVLHACSHAGLVDDARKLFTSMCKDYGLQYTTDHYMCMVDILGRAGHLQEAQDLIKDLPPDKAAGAWMGLLSACRVHSDIERGKYAANRCLELDPTNDAVYVMLSNIYSDAGKWDDAANVREVMASVPLHCFGTV